jgi:hypothetical protein
VTRGPIRYAVESNHGATDPAGARHRDDGVHEVPPLPQPPAKRPRGRPNRSAAQAVALTAAKKRQKQAAETDLDLLEIEE